MALSSENNSYTEFECTYSMQSVTIPSDGIYLLECWGPGGSEGGTSGGYSSGYKKLLKGTVVYVCVGQCAAGRSTQEEWGNRYNGGQDGSASENPSHWSGKHPGAGCTHMALVSGVLASLSERRDEVLIVAGGAGASAFDIDGKDTFGSGVGGAGGGLSGYKGSSEVQPGTQTTGYAFGLGGPSITAGSQDAYGKSGGGAGWYGGHAGRYGGAGGSGYIGGVPAFTFNGVVYKPTTTTGAGQPPLSDGAAKITKVSDLYIPVIFNGTHLQNIIFNGTAIEHLIFNGTQLY